MSDALISHHAELNPQLGAPREQRALDVVTPDADGNINCDVVIVGSGMGGSTFAHALRDSGLDIVIVERGDFLPREIQNWSTESVFAEGRYRNAEQWLDESNQPFSPGVFYYVGGNTKFYGAMLPRFREEDFAEIQHVEAYPPPGRSATRNWNLGTPRPKNSTGFMARRASIPASPGAQALFRNLRSTMTRRWRRWRQACAVPGSNPLSCPQRWTMATAVTACCVQPVMDTPVLWTPKPTQRCLP